MKNKQARKEEKCRCKKCVSFRKEYLFEYLDIYGLYYHLASYIYPRLEAFRDNTYSNPMELDSKKWTTILNKMIFAFKTIAKDGRDGERKKIEEGLNLFCKYFTDLWI